MISLWWLSLTNFILKDPNLNPSFSTHDFHRLQKGTHLLSSVCSAVKWGHIPQPSGYLEANIRGWERKVKKEEREGGVVYNRSVWWHYSQPKKVTQKYLDLWLKQGSMIWNFLLHILLVSKAISAGMLLHGLFLCLTVSERGFNDLYSRRQKRDNAYNCA